MTHSPGNDMLTEQEVIAIYAQYDIVVTPKDALKDIEHMRGFAKTHGHASELVHGYARQMQAERVGDMREAAAFAAA